jgi:hypothetical protein
MGTEIRTSANGSLERYFCGSVPTVPINEHYMAFKEKKDRNRHFPVCIRAYRDFGVKNGTWEQEVALCGKV